MKTILTFCLLSAGILSVNAQNEMDALRFSQTTPTGTARSTSMGGAFGALGGDFSSLSINPAGIGVYKKSEITFTPVLSGMHAASSYLGESNTDYRYALGFNNLGIVINTDLSKEFQESGWVGIQYGFGMNKTNIYNNRYWIEGYNSKSSIMDMYWDNAKGLNPDELSDFDTGLAFDTYLLDDTSSAADSVDFYTPSNGGVLQRKTITGKGAINEMVFSLGGNYKDKFYLGATVGVPYLRYVERSTYEEIDENDTVFDFNSLKIQDYQKTKGNGLNFKFGMIYRPFDWLRIGGAFHTPTFFGINDRFNRTISAEYEGTLGSQKASSPNNDFDYTLTTPMRAIGSIAFVIGTAGLISADYEYVNYNESRLDSESDNFANANDAIQTKYRSQRNLRIGGEVRLDPITLRAGYANYGSPFHTSINDGSRQSYSLGLGLRDDDYFMDFAYVMTVYNEDYYLYSGADRTSIEGLHNQFMFTIGFKY